MAGKAGRIDERSINDKIGEVLRSLNPNWDEDNIVTENTRMLAEGKGKKPDIVVWTPNGLPVVIESEYTPAQYLERDDARPRLGQTLSRGGEPVEQVIALRIPKELGDVTQSALIEEVRKARYEFCLISEPAAGNPKGRWPSQGWVEGGGRPVSRIH